MFSQKQSKEVRDSKKILKDKRLVAKRGCRTRKVVEVSWMS